MSDSMPWDKGTQPTPPKLAQNDPPPQPSEVDPEGVAPASAPREAPGNQAETTPIEVALWGPPKAGKTTLLAQLYLQQKSAVSGWMIYPTEASLPFIKEMSEVIDQKNIFPGATLEGTRARITYDFRNIIDRRMAVLNTEDRPGMDYKNLPPEIKEMLSEAEGLVMLFDPSNRPEAEFHKEVRETLESVYHARQQRAEVDPRPVAVCLSKSDDRIKNISVLRYARRDPDAFVRDWIDPVVIEALDRFCGNNYRFFPVSSVGLNLRWGSIEPVVFFDDRLQARLRRAGETLNLIEPFIWLFNEVEARRGG